MQRKIIHVDMDCYYAAVEQLDHPEWRGKPVIVSGPPNSRSVVGTASYEARKFGVRSAMPSSEAYRLCPQGIFAPPRFERYKEISKQIREIFYRYTDLVEPLSLDEAFLDVTQNKKAIVSAIQIAMEIRKAISEEIGLTASAGVSINKFVAKVASDFKKPDGLTVVLPEQVEEFMAALPIEKFFGVGKVTAEKMHRLNISTGADIKARTEQELMQMFGKSGRFYYNVVRGIDRREVIPEREHKSAGAENTFEYDIDSIPELIKELENIVDTLVVRLQRYKLSGRTVTLKIKYADFKQVTRSKSFPRALDAKEDIFSAAQELLLNELINPQKIRLLGVTLNNLDSTASNSPQQLRMDL